MRNIILLSALVFASSSMAQLVVKTGNDGTIYSPQPVKATSMELTTPVLTGAITGTYTLAGTPTLTSPTLNTPTLVTPVISTGLSASGSAANTFAGSTGTFITSTGAFSSAASSFTVTPAITPTGGVAAAGGFTASPRNCHAGDQPAIATASGTNTTDNTAGMVYFSEVFVPANVSVTGVAIFNGTAVAGNGKVMLYDGTGARLAISASTAMSGTTAYQLIAFTGAPIAVKGPATYFIGAIYDTTTHDLRGWPVGSYATGTDAGNTYATDSTFATITVTSTFLADLGPIASLY